MWNPGTIQTLQDTAQYNTGRVGMEALNAVIAAVRQAQPSFDFANPAVSSVSGNVTWTTAQALRSSPGRLYHLRVVNTDEDDDVNVILYDDVAAANPVGGCVVPAQVAASGAIAAVPGVAEVSFFAAPGAGQRIRTTLYVRAVQSDDGSTAASANTLSVFALTSA